MSKHPRNLTTFNRPDKVWYLRQTAPYPETCLRTSYGAASTPRCWPWLTSKAS